MNENTTLVCKTTKYSLTRSFMWCFLRQNSDTLHWTVPDGLTKIQSWKNIFYKKKGASFLLINLAVLHRPRSCTKNYEAK